MLELTIFLLVLGLSLDSFSTSFAYSVDKIEIPLKSKLILSLLSSITLVFSLYISNLLNDIIPNIVTNILSFSIIFILSLTKLLDYKIKSLIKKNKTKSTFKFLNFNFMLEVLVESTNADFDKSQVLSPYEALTLGLVLSIDSFFAGLAISDFHISLLLVLVYSLIINLFMISIGSYFAKLVIKKTDINLSWLSGIILLLIAFSKLFN